MLAKLHNSSNSAASNSSQAENDDFEIINDTNESNENREEIFKRLELDLRNQIKIANTNTQYFTNLGDVANASKYIFLLFFFFYFQK